MGGTTSLPVGDSISGSARESATSLHHVPVTGEAGEEEEQNVDEEGVGNGNDCAQWNGPAGVLQLPWSDRSRERERGQPSYHTYLARGGNLNLTHPTTKSRLSPDMLAPAMMPVQPLKRTAKTLAKVIMAPVV